jgi:hypothetical protein
MVSSKILWNSVISTKGARFAGTDIKNMYLETPLDQFEYMNMPITLFPANIIEHYKLNEKVLDGYVYMEIQKGMYDCHRWEYLPTNYLRNFWCDMDTLNNPTHQDYGNMLLTTYGSTLCG